MLQNLTGWHALVILAIVLLVFGSAKLPGLAKSMGESVRILKDEVNQDTAGSAADPTPASRATTSQATVEPLPDRHVS